MLEAISDVHDCHSELLERNSTAELTAAGNDGKVHLLLAASGSVATIKLPNIINALARHRNLSIRVILTASAAHFLAGQAAEQPSISALQLLPNVDAVYQDSHEWMPQWRRGAPILHIELRRWCDLLVIAPLSMNTLASIVAGLCNNLLLSVIRAWDTNGKIDGQKKRILVAPVSLPIQSYSMILLNVIKAANTAMWNHPITAKQIKVLVSWIKNREILRSKPRHQLTCETGGVGR
jgi:phosphopantothenoylcysteine decarboxylase